MAASASDTRGPSSTLALPDFCESRAVLAIVLIVELVALMFAISRHALHASFWLDLAASSLFLLWIGLTCAGVLCRTRTWLHTLPASQASLIAMAMMLASIGVDCRGGLPVRVLLESGAARHRHHIPDRTCRLPAAQPRRRIHRQRAGVALLLCERRVEAQRRDGGAGAHPCAAGAHPSALPLQQHEYHRCAHTLVAGARRAGGRGSGGSVPRQPERRQRAHHAARRDRHRAHARAHRAAAPARSVARALGCGQPADARRRCRA